jgi:antitoxin FitA
MSHTLAPNWRYIFPVPSVQIKNVPDDVHRVLRTRAAATGQSLQEYLLARLTEEASRPTLDEVLSRASDRASGSVPLAEAARSVRAERDAR